MKTRRSGLWLAACLLGSVAHAAEPQQLDLGGADELFALLQQPAGARALALGSAFEAVVDDPSGVLWNPAAPAFAPGFGLSMNHENWLVGTEREVLSAQLPLRPWLALGLQGSLINYGAVELRDQNGISAGYFNPQEQGLGGTVAVRLGKGAVGATGRYMRMQFPGDEMNAFAGDLGLLWEAGPRLRLSTVFKSTPIQDGARRLHGSGGLAYKSAAGLWQWGLSSSVRLDPSAASELDLGAELGWGRDVPVALRAGYSQSFPDLGSDLGQRLTLGLGAGYQYYRMDYAYLPWGDFGATHRFSLSYQWQAPPEAPAAPAPASAPAPAPAPTALPTPEAVATAVPAPVPSPTPETATAARPLDTRFRVLSDAVVQARALESEGRVSSALKLYNQAATADPDDLAAWKGMAQIYERAGRADYARQCWQQVLRLDPGDPAAAAALQPVQP